MATLKSFEDILARKKARDLCRIVGAYTDEGRFKKNFNLLDQVERSSGSIMDNMQKILKEVVAVSFSNFYTFQRVHAVNSGLSFIEHWTVRQTGNGQTVNGKQ